MLYEMLVFVMAIGRIQGQANDSSFAWASIYTDLDGKKGIVEAYLGEEIVINTEGDFAGSEEEWKESYCFLDGGFNIPSMRLSLVVEQQVLQGEGGERDVSSFVRVVMVKDEEGIMRVGTFQSKFQSSHSN